MSILRALASAAVLLGASSSRADGLAEAKAHFEKGQTHYTLGEFAEAAAEFKEAFRLKHEPAILYNVAQAMRQSHQYQQAYFYYSQFLHLKPDAPNRSEVEGLMVQMKQKVEEKEEYERGHPQVTLDDEAKKPEIPARLTASPSAPSAAVTAAASQPAPSAAVTATASPTAPAEAAAATASPAKHGARATRIAGYVVGAAGVLAEGAALVFHSGAQSSADQFNHKYADHTLTAADAHLKGDAQSKGRLATAAAVSGGLLLVTGAVLTFAF